MPIEETKPSDVTTPGTDNTDPTTGSSEKDDCPPDVQSGDHRDYSDGKGTGQDKYLTDPIPEDKPMPVEPEDQDISKVRSYTCTFSIECSTVNGWYPNYGCSRYQLAQGDVVEWRYTCKGLGKDIGCDWIG